MPSPLPFKVTLGVTGGIAAYKPPNWFALCSSTRSMFTS